MSDFSRMSTPSEVPPELPTEKVRKDDPLELPTVYVQHNGESPDPSDFPTDRVRVGAHIERGQIIGQAGYSGLYHFDDRSFYQEWRDRHPGEQLDMGIEQQREFLTSEAERPHLRLGPSSLMDAALVEAAKKFYEAGPKADEQSAADQDEPRVEIVVYTEKLGDPVDYGYDKGH